MVKYCNNECKNSHFPEHKDKCLEFRDFLQKFEDGEDVMDVEGEHEEFMLPDLLDPNNIAQDYCGNCRNHH